jgi:hypothetical protein
MHDFTECILTDMHQQAFPGEDISDRPLPEEHAVPGLLALLSSDLPSGRYPAREVQARAEQMTS